MLSKTRDHALASAHQTDYVAHRRCSRRFSSGTERCRLRSEGMEVYRSRGWREVKRWEVKGLRVGLKLSDGAVSCCTAGGQV